MILRLVLWVIGVALTVASRTSARVRGQLACDMVMLVESRDGVARHYIIRDRHVTSRAGSYDKPRCTLRFRTSGAGVRVLLAWRTIDAIMAGLENGDVEIIGEASLVLWFYQLTMGAIPFSFPAPDPWPHSYTAHDPSLKASRRITREPSVTSGDGLISDAARAQRDKTLLWEVGRGAEPSGKVLTHNIVVDLSTAGSEQKS